MRKNFDEWNNIKQKLQMRVPPAYVQDREIWFCKLGANIGSEQDGVGQEFLRAVIVVKRLSKSVCIVVPLTTKCKQDDFHFTFLFKRKKRIQRSSAIVSQVKLIDTKRFVYRIGVVTLKDFKEIKEKLIQLLK